jgi:hypothetical protein
MAALIALLVGITLTIWWVNRRAAPVEWLDGPPARQRSRLAFLGNWSQPVRTQLLRAKFWFFGPPPSLTIRGKIVDLDAAALPNLELGPISFSNGSGVHAWIVSDARVWHHLTNAGARVISAPTVSVGNNMQAQISITDRVSFEGRPEDVGIRLDLWPHLRGESINLATFLVITEAFDSTANSAARGQTNAAFIRTNAAFGARAHLPKGSSLLLMSQTTNQQGKVIVVWISPGAP